VTVSNADRVVFPEDGLTKGDVAAYYETVSDVLLCFVADRALTVERYPRGIGDEGFMQKNAPEHLTAETIGRHEVPKDGGGTTVYPVVRDREGILAFANLGVITFHVPPSTIEDPDHPDWVIWDIDPPAGRFDLARAAALALQETLDSFDVTTGLMTSGSNGYHLRSRLDGSVKAETVAGLARALAALAAHDHPSLLTLAFRKSEREGRVFVDWLRNAPYSTSVSPWSLRPRPGAPVAMPIGWAEIDAIDPNTVRLRDAPARLEAQPWAGLERLEMGVLAQPVEEALRKNEIVLQPFDRFRS
jgi:bifunctional non-homologous end joining protein LigD